MGADLFDNIAWIVPKPKHTYVKNDPNLKKAFNDLTEHAKEYYGRGGYTGTIAEKNDFCIAGVMTKNQFDNVYDKWRQRGKWADFKTFLERFPSASLRCWQECDDTSGNACAVILKDDRKEITVKTPNKLVFEKLPSPKKPIVVDYVDGSRIISERYETVTEAQKDARIKFKDKGWEAHVISRSTPLYDVKKDYIEKRVNAVKVRFFGLARI